MVGVLASIIGIVFSIITWTIIIRIIISWIPMVSSVRIDPYNPVISLIFSITDPILEPLKPYTTMGMLDLSPIVAIIGLQVIEGILLMLLGMPPPSGGILF